MLQLLGEGRQSKELVLDDLSQFYDYSQPHAAGIPLPLPVSRKLVFIERAFL